MKRPSWWWCSAAIPILGHHVHERFIHLKQSGACGAIGHGGRGSIGSVDYGSILRVIAPVRSESIELLVY
jgi:hypothetical protein